MQLLELNRAVFWETNPIPIKYLMRRLGLLALNEHRLPMTPAVPALEQRLANLGGRLQKARRDLQISEEQLAFQTEVADEAHTRMLVAGTPLADREAREARDDLTRLRRQRDDARAVVEDLVREQDRLLDRLSGKLSAGGGN